MPSLAILAITLCLIPLGCSTGGSSKVAVETEEMPDDFLTRPRFEKPAARPLGRVLLRWGIVDDADGYELQMSDTESFLTIGKTWTIRGYNLELPIESDVTIWFRIRSFNKKATSRWSAPLIVDEASL
jgi:hypothetical protein